MDNPSGYYDQKTQTIYPESDSTWEGLSTRTWAGWTEWAYSRSPLIIWPTPALFLGNNPATVNLEITCVSTGIVNYKVYTSDTGAFAGEEVLTDIAHTAGSVPAFKARFIQVVVYSNQVLDSTVTITNIDVRAKTPVATELIINDIDSAGCEGTNLARVIPLPQPVGTIVDIKVTPREVPAYALDVYVTNTPTSTYVIPKVISKSNTAPTFALVGIDNQPRDAVVDIIIKSLPNTYMSGNNLVIE